ncbi:glycosyltransferase family 2 protein [Jiella avicenniae]|uniref:Glycosyltransferase n=1 Tax=Jiella avicenniae TaxID=2907202 RepID=A0A9X1NZY2_9HYPH|nr:glycosyltransferase family 2 protein [Jiella avicenniae]MCE7026811.1 glycosyltransferase [Jiella avicenniae]
MQLFEAMGVSHIDAVEANLAARRHGSDIAAELIGAGLVTERHYGECFAAQFGLRFAEIGEDDRILNGAEMLGRAPPRLVKVCNDRLDARLFVCPTIESLDGFAAYLNRLPEMRCMVRITSRSVAARAVDRQTMAERYRAARASLSAETPELSARTAIEPFQAAFVVAALVAVAIGLWFLPALTFAIGHGAGTMFFTACLAMRLPAALAPRSEQVSVTDLPAPGVLEEGWQGVPVYSVLVALHNETAMVPKLVAALEALDWPKTRLDVKLVCEADDEATSAAVSRAIAGRPQFSLVLVPPGAPRTKPKALNHALPLAHGEFLVLYDAEDEPDPGQLREAYLRFRTGPANLACLQAPLVVTNGEAHWLAALFAMEYAALFRRLLPWLARTGLPVPLGGTSNHFVRESLVAIGGWDSHNVTEDADLGIRLHRAGYRIGTLTRPTLEHAPERWHVWHRQRTRWMKGWFVTYLLHMRRPLKLTRELGIGTMLAFQLMFLGMLVSSLAHPVLLGLVAIQFGMMALGFASIRDLSPVTVLDLANVAAAYGLFVVMSAQGLSPVDRRPLQGRSWLLPAYWVLLAFASARALLQLMIAPHKWEKTPHGIDSRADSNDPRYRVEPFFGDAPATELAGAARLVNGPSALPSADVPWPFSAPLQDARVHAR